MQTLTDQIVHLMGFDRENFDVTFQDVHDDIA